MIKDGLRALSVELARYGYEGEMEIVLPYKAFVGLVYELDIELSQETCMRVALPGGYAIVRADQSHP